MYGFLKNHFKAKNTPTNERDNCRVAPLPKTPCIMYCLYIYLLEYLYFVDAIFIKLALCTHTHTHAIFTLLVVVYMQKKSGI